MYDERLNDKMNDTKTNVAASAVERLVSCPFCGKKQGVIQANGGCWKVECYNCFAQGPHDVENKEIAIKRWKKRAS